MTFNAKSSGALDFTIYDERNPSDGAPADTQGKTWKDEMDFTYKVTKSSPNPQEFMIVVEAKGCNNTVRTQSVLMKAKAVKMPDITPELVKFQTKVNSAAFHPIYDAYYFNECLSICRYAP